MENNLDTGKMIVDYFVKNRIRKVALARKLNRNASHIMYLQKQPSLQTQSLWELCHALKHNFFADIASLLPKTYSNSVAIDSTNIQKIAFLEQEIMILKAEKAVLLEAIGAK